MAAPSAAQAGIARRYAQALHDVAAEHGEVPAVERDLLQLRGMLEGSHELRRFVDSPLVGRDARRDAVAALGEKAELASATRNVLGVLAKNGRLGLLPAVVEAFRLLLAAQRGEADAEVVAAVELTAAQRHTIEAAAARFAGKKVTVTHKVDPRLLGGLTVRVGSRMVDASVRHKLQLLEQSMRGTA